MFPRTVNQDNFNRVKTEKELKGNKEKQAFTLLKREEIGAKKSRVEYVLVQQYTGKYGSKNSSSSINAYIKSAVQEILSKSEDGKLSEAVLESLEADIRKNTEAMKSQIRQKSADEKSSSKLSTSNSQQISNNAPNNEENFPGDSNLSDFDPNKWSVISSFLLVNDEEKNKREQNLLLQKNADFRRGLDNQKVILETRKKETLEDKQNFANMMKKSMDKFDEEEKNNKKKLQDRIRQEKEMREKQINDRIQQRDREREEKITRENFEIAHILKLAEDEEIRKREKKEASKKAREAVKEENERYKSLKEEMLKKQAMEEIQQAKEYQ